ncbi:MAG: 1-phosphofructokinase family hexose kinase [Corynebacterium sp.]|nr:1-phosphofructokinase family hexose kinase [Corynebacterium sp.]
MIVTITPNPSIDATVSLPSVLNVGAVNRASNMSHVAGGKGINVARAIYLAGKDSLAMFPCSGTDPLLSFIGETGIAFRNIEISGYVRTNTALTEPDGRTTKLNGPGPRLDSSIQTELLSAIASASSCAQWVVMGGSLPAGLDSDFYTQAIGEIRRANPQVRIAVDTSDAPLHSLQSHLKVAAPDLIKPNSVELGQFVSRDGEQIEIAAIGGDYSLAIAAVCEAIDRGVPEVLATLGPAGAVLANKSGVWVATSPAVTVVSTVGAGDSALSGYLLAREDGAGFAESLRLAVSYGAAAAALPGTTIPSPSQLIHTGADVWRVR